MRTTETELRPARLVWGSESSSSESMREREKLRPPLNGRGKPVPYQDNLCRCVVTRMCYEREMMLQYHMCSTLL